MSERASELATAAVLVSQKTEADEWMSEWMEIVLRWKNFDDIALDEIDLYKMASMNFPTILI